MSANAPPISPARFAAALPSLPLSSLHSKAAELQNSIFHLQRSNAQLQPLAEEGDQDCRDAIVENEAVIGRMQERIGLLRAEVEGRGYKWGEDAPVEPFDGRGEEANGERIDGVNGRAESVNSHDRSGDQINGGRGGQLGDEELARRLRERMEEDADEDGMHL